MCIQNTFCKDFSCPKCNFRAPNLKQLNSEFMKMLQITVLECRDCGTKDIKFQDFIKHTTECKETNRKGGSIKTLNRRSSAIGSGLSADISK